MRSLCAHRILLARGKTTSPAGRCCCRLLPGIFATTLIPSTGSSHFSPSSASRSSGTSSSSGISGDGVSNSSGGSSTSNSSVAGTTTSSVSSSTTSPGPAANGSRMPLLHDSIVLTEGEEQLFRTLLEAARAAGLSTTLRCAGGWVRDKLLGRDSPDIDVALDDLYGKEFAERVNEYLGAQGEETRSVAVIQSNPDQSKHLETARMKVGRDS